MRRRPGRIPFRWETRLARRAAISPRHPESEGVGARLLSQARKGGTKPVSTRQLRVLYRFGLARAELREKFGEFRVSLGKHRDRKESRVGGAGLADRKSRDGNPLGHLHDRQQ